MTGLQYVSWILLLAVYGLWSRLPHGWSSSGGIFLGHIECLTHPILCYHRRSQHLSGFCLWMLLVTVLHCQVPHSLGTAFHPLHAKGLLLDLYHTHLFSGIIVLIIVEGLVCILLDYVLALLYRFWYMLFHFHSHFGDISFLNGSHSSAVHGKYFPSNSLYLKRFSVFFVSRCTFLWVHKASWM